MKARTTGVESIVLIERSGRGCGTAPNRASGTDANLHEVGDGPTPDA